MVMCVEQKQEKWLVCVFVFVKNFVDCFVARSKTLRQNDEKKKLCVRAKIFDCAILLAAIGNERREENVCTIFRFFAHHIKYIYCQQICFLVAMLIRFFLLYHSGFRAEKNVQIVRENKIELFCSIIIVVKKTWNIQLNITSMSFHSLHILYVDCNFFLPTFILSYNCIIFFVVVFLVW